MLAGQPQIPGRSAIRSQFVGDDRLGVNALVLQQFPMRLMSRALVATLMEQNVQHLAFVIDGPPHIHPLVANLHYHLIEMPSTGWPRP